MWHNKMDKMTYLTYALFMLDFSTVVTSAKKPRRRRSDGRSARASSGAVMAGGTAQTIRQIEQGFPFAAVTRLHNASGLAVGRIAELIRIPQRTLMRRRAQGRLRPDESERLLRISRIFAVAVDLFEDDVESARRWLTTPSSELDGQSPLDFARTEVGAREVEDLIGRLNHGVFT
jgi:putative toxin-antitoxin system antitoxin component (TIGR02293 family)